MAGELGEIYSHPHRYIDTFRDSDNYLDSYDYCNAHFSCYPFNRRLICRSLRSLGINLSGQLAFEELLDLSFAPAPPRFRAFPHDARIALKRNQPVAGVGPILNFLDADVITGLATGATAEECSWDIDHVRRALALV
jgi:hypothetical protein